MTAETTAAASAPLDLEAVKSCAKVCRNSPMVPGYDDAIDTLRYRHAPALIAEVERLRELVEDVLDGAEIDRRLADSANQTLRAWAEVRAQYITEST